MWPFNPLAGLVWFFSDSKEILSSFWRHTHLINAAEQSFGGLILLRGASCLNGLQESLRRQSHHPVQQTQQEGHNQLERKQKDARRWARWAAAATSVKKKSRVTLLSCSWGDVSVEGSKYVIVAIKIWGGEKLYKWTSFTWIFYCQFSSLFFLLGVHILLQAKARAHLRSIIPIQFEEDTKNPGSELLRVTLGLTQTWLLRLNTFEKCARLRLLGNTFLQCAQCNSARVVVPHLHNLLWRVRGEILKMINIADEEVQDVRRHQGDVLIRVLGEKADKTHTFFLTITFSLSVVN